MKHLLIFLVTITIGYSQEQYLTVPSPLDSAGVIRMIQPIYRPYHFNLLPYQDDWYKSTPVDWSKILIPEILKLWKEYKQNNYFLDTTADHQDTIFTKTKLFDTLDGFMEYLERVK